MSCNYAEGLSPYENKGILGAAEKFDSADEVKEKCATLARLIKEAKSIVVHTGAGISTSAGIPDFRGPNGVWTLEEQGLKPDINISFNDAKPTKTHMAIKQLVDNGLVQYIVSQNIDGLHLKSGIKRRNLAELHGNMFIDQCNFCKRQFVRSSPTTTVGRRSTGVQCHGGGNSRKPCRGKFHDTILDWEDNLPDDDLELSDKFSGIADLSICLGSTLQINPSGNIPLNTLRYGGKLVLCNLQPTKHDNKADLIINTYVDDVFDEIMRLLDMKIPEYNSEEDPVNMVKKQFIEWTVPKEVIAEAKIKFKNKCGNGVTRRVLVKREYKIQQDELKVHKKMLKQNIVKKPKVEIKIPKPVIVKVIKKINNFTEDVIELDTSDDDDVVLVNNINKTSESPVDVNLGSGNESDEKSDVKDTKIIKKEIVKMKVDKKESDIASNGIVKTESNFETEIGQKIICGKSEFPKIKNEELKNSGEMKKQINSEDERSQENSDKEICSDVKSENNMESLDPIVSSVENNTQHDSR